MSLGGWLRKEAWMPVEETKWWKDVITGDKPFTLSSHNAMHANATRELGNNWVTNHPDATAAAVLATIFSGGTATGAAGSAGGEAGAVGAGAGSAAGGAAAGEAAGSGLTYGGYSTAAPSLGGGTSTALSSGVDMAGAGYGSAGAEVGSSGSGLLNWNNAYKGAQLTQQSGLLNRQQQAPMQQGQISRQGPDFSGLLTAQGQLDAQRIAEQEKRKQQQQMIVQGLLGGAYGR